MKEQSQLQQTQQVVWNLITAPEGVERVVAQNPSLQLPIKGTDRLSAVERLDIYANMYFYRIRDSLKDDFPALLALIGETRFHNLITDYLLQYPSTHWTLRNVGQLLPNFLTTHELKTPWPMVIDLARFEWELIEAFDAEDAEPLTLSRLTEIEPERWSELHFSLVPSCSMVALEYRADRLYEQLLAGKPLSSGLKPESNHLIVWRRRLKVLYRVLAPMEAVLLRGILQKASFAELCEMAIGEGGEEKALSCVSSFLHTWVQEGLLADSI